MKEAPEKWATWMKHARELPLQMEYKTWQSPAGTPFGAVPSQRVQIKRNRTGTLLLSLLEDVSVNQCRCCGLNKLYAFEIKRQTPNDPWLLANVQKVPISNEPSMINIMLGRNSTGVQANGPFLLYKYDAASLVKEPGFAVKKANRVEKAGRTLVQVHFSCSRTKDNPDYSQLYHYEHGWLMMDPERSWCLLEYEADVEWPAYFNPNIKTHVQGTLEYTETKSGLITMKSEVVRVKGGGKGVNLDLNHYSSYVFEDRDPAPEEFTLTAFGLPEPPGLRSSVPLYVWLFAIAAICGIAAALIYWRKGHLLNKNLA